MSDSDFQFRRGMKAKTIKSVLAKKFGDFLQSIEDDTVRGLVKKNSIITGGCIASMLLGEKVNDFDIYFANRETALAVAKYYVERFKQQREEGIKAPISVDEDRPDRVAIVIKSAGIASEKGTYRAYEYFEGSPDERTAGYVSEMMDDTGDIQDAYERTEEMALEVEQKNYRPVFLSTNAITLSDKVQLVLRFYGSAEDIHKNYDFVHCTNYWTSADGKLTLHPAALEALLSRELRYVGSLYPVCSVIRLRKFIKRGWVINAGQILKMMMQISALDLTDHEVLQDQLTGVDAAYFVEIIERIKEKDPEKVNSAYLIEIIDRMF